MCALLYTSEGLLMVDLIMQQKVLDITSTIIRLAVVEDVRLRLFLKVMV